MTKTIEELIGENIRRERKRLGYSQIELGEQVGLRLGVSWKSQTVSAAEKGRRQFIAAELVVLAHVLECRVQDLVTAHPPEPIQVTEQFIREPDYSAPFEKTLDGVEPDVSRLMATFLRPMSEAYRSVRVSQEQAEELRHALRMAERALAGFMPGDDPDADWLEGAKELPGDDDAPPTA